MRVAGLKPIDTVIESSAVLIQSKNPSDPKLIEKIKGRIKGWAGMMHPFPRCSQANAMKLLKNTSIASITSSVAIWRLRAKLRLESDRPLS
jgi:ATP phosphoribosyltransferase